MKGLDASDVLGVWAGQSRRHQAEDEFHISRRPLVQRCYSAERDQSWDCLPSWAQKSSKIEARMMKVATNLKDKEMKRHPQSAEDYSCWTDIFQFTGFCKKKKDLIGHECIIRVQWIISVMAHLEDGKLECSQIYLLTVAFYLLSFSCYSCSKKRKYYVANLHWQLSLIKLIPIPIPTSPLYDVVSAAYLHTQTPHRRGL